MSTTTHTCFCGRPATESVPLDAYDVEWLCPEHLATFRHADGSRPAVTVGPDAVVFEPRRDD